MKKYTFPAAIFLVILFLAMSASAGSTMKLPGIINEADSITRSMNYELYPNPLKDKLTVTFLNGDPAPGEATIEIYDIMGRLLTDSDVESRTTAIDFSKYNKGIYFVRVLEGGKVTTSRVVKE